MRRLATSKRIAIAFGLLGTLLASTVSLLPAHSFELGPHEQILRRSLPPLGVRPNPLTDVIGSFPSGRGNLGSDRNQSDAFRHFDSAARPTDVCTRARDAWDHFYLALRRAVKPNHPPDYDQIGGVDDARSAFGALTHSLHDFYAHSNWIEIYLAGNQSPPTAAALFPTCDPILLPANLQTGYYRFELTNWGGCPSGGPPAPFTFCHETLNKDGPGTLEGRKIVPGLGITYHALAVQLAEAHTTALYGIVTAALLRDWTADFPSVHADCLINHVFQDSTAACRLGQLTIVNDTTNGITLKPGTVDILSAPGQTVASYPVASWPPAPIQTSVCLKGMQAKWSFEVADRYPLPTVRRTTGTTTLASSTCDATLRIFPESTLGYLVLFRSTDTVLAAYTNVIAVVNGGARTVQGGPVASGHTIVIDLGPCTTVNDYDFTVQFTDPKNGAARTATPNPPPYAREQGCEDNIVFGDLGRQLYPP